MAEMRAELVGLLIEKHGERAKIKLDKDKSKGEKIPKYLEADRKSTRLNSSHDRQSRMPSSA